MPSVGPILPVPPLASAATGPVYSRGMRVLVIGSGGREHALSWRLSDEHDVHAAPGNPGIAACAECHSIGVADQTGLVELANSLRPDLVLVGPENPLIDGLADRLRESGHDVFGPGAEGAQLEGSKAFSKALMREAAVPTARFRSFEEPNQAKAFARELFATGRGAVVKASGPAFGKGAVVCANMAEAEETIEAMMVERQFGDSGATVIVEEKLSGPEFSLMTLVSDGHYCSLPVAQDYKRIGKGDTGPNTGGMGSYSPVDWLSDDLIGRTESEIVEPILRAMAARGIPFRGVLFSGLMVDSGTPYCIEYNVRFGDPETESQMARLGKGFGDSLLACAKGEPIPPFEVLDRAAVTAMIASRGYPESSQAGIPIRIDQARTKEVQVFHAGTRLVDEQLVTAGGRVLAVTGTGESVPEARAKVFEAILGIDFDGMQYRRDIAG